MTTTITDGMPGGQKVAVYATAARLRAQAMLDEARRIEYLPTVIESAISAIRHHADHALMAVGTAEAFAHADAAHAHADAAHHRIRTIAGGCQGEFHAVMHAGRLDDLAADASEQAEELSRG